MWPGGAGCFLRARCLLLSRGHRERGLQNRSRDCGCADDRDHLTRACMHTEFFVKTITGHKYCILCVRIYSSHIVRTLYIRHIVCTRTYNEIKFKRRRRTAPHSRGLRKTKNRKAVRCCSVNGQDRLETYTHTFEDIRNKTKLGLFIYVYTCVHRQHDYSMMQARKDVT